MQIITIVITFLLLSGCSTSGWTVDTDIYTWGEDKCQVRKSDIKLCRRFE